MKPTIKKKWIAALTSGKYKQGKSFLRTDENRFCCLGVLCDLHAKATGGKWERDNYYMGNSEVLPKAVAEWAGLDPLNVNAVYGKDEDHCLTEDNDQGKSFSTIAKLIEAHL